MRSALPSTKASGSDPCPLTGRFPIRPLVILLCAFALAAPASADVTRGSLWYRDAVCETGSDPPDWRYGAPGHHGAGGIYEGGIAFWYGTWDGYKRHVRGAARFDHAYDAPPYLQAAVAEWLLEHVGTWGCLHVIRP